MPLKHGKSPETVAHNIKEMMKAGHPQKQAIAASMSMKRKYEKMDAGGMAYSEGGMVGDDMDQDAGSDFNENASRNINELQDLGDSHPNDVENPEMQDHQRMLAKALFEKSEENEKGFAMGGLVEDESGDEEPDESEIEHMAEGGEAGSMLGKEKNKMSEPLMTGQSDETMKAIMEHKKKRKFGR